MLRIPLRRLAFAAALAASAKKSSTTSRNSPGVVGSLIRVRSRFPSTSPWVYQPVNVRSLCIANRNGGVAVLRQGVQINLILPSQINGPLERVIALAIEIVN